ncbi:TPA: FUSC family protein [Legionella pneumophila]|nr:FUSC family protein [Legionella pneumophila]
MVTVGIDQQKTVRTLRLSLTCIFLFLITWYYQVPESAWTLVTIWFVMYEYSTVGGVLTKSFLRFAGTALSAIYGMIIVYFCANNPLINIMALVPGLFLYAYFFMGGDKTYIGTIGAVTLTIVLLNYNDIDTAVLRVFNVIIGVIGSMFMIRFFYPQYARDKVLEIQLNFITQLANLLESYLNPTQSLAAVQTKYLDYERKMLDGFTLYNRYIGEAKIETKKAPFFIPHSIAAMQHFRRLFRLFSVFVYYLSTEEIRSDPWVCDQLSKLLCNLQSLQRKLLKQDAGPIGGDVVAAEPEEEIVIETPNIENKIATEAIVNNMQKEIALLDTEIKEIILIYDVYDIRLNEM